MNPLGAEFYSQATKPDNPKDIGDGKYYVLNSRFIKQTSGCIIMNTTLATSILLVESTSFVKDTKNYTGNCIFLSRKGQCIQNKVCSSFCYLIRKDIYGHHSYTSIDDSRDSNNIVNMTSVVSFGNEIASYTIEIDYGNQQAYNVNISNGLCQYYAAMSLSYGIGTRVVKFCSFSNCNATKKICLGFYNIPTQISFCNIEENTADECITSFLSKTTIENCTICKNRGKYLFRGGGVDERIGWFNLVHCIVIDNNYGDFFTSGEVTTNNMKTDSLNIIFEDFYIDSCKLKKCASNPINEEIDFISRFAIYTTAPIFDIFM